MNIPYFPNRLKLGNGLVLMNEMIVTARKRYMRFDSRNLNRWNFMKENIIDENVPSISDFE